MGTQRISVDTDALRAAAAGNGASADALNEYRQACEQWLTNARRQVLHHYGPVAAPVADALNDFYTGLGDQASTTTDRHRDLEAALDAAAKGYDDTDSSGATAVSAAGGVV